MKNISVYLFCLTSWLAAGNLDVHAQIIPDNTIPITSNVAQTGNNIDISGGTQSGKNLFHSFREFSVNSGEIANFRQQDIDFVFSRITSNQRSNLDGIINIIGSGELIFINPNGISFGKNTQINSNFPVTFSTANSIKFGNKLFNTSDRFNSVSELPNTNIFDLHFNSPGNIELTGDGFTNILKSPETVPFTSFLTNSLLAPNRFSTAPKTVLAGNGINLRGSLLNTNGQLKIFSIHTGNIRYDEGNHKLIDASLSNLNLSNRSQIESLGIPFQGIEINAKDVVLGNSSNIIGTNLGGVSTNNIEINAETVRLSGITDLIASGIISNAPEFLFTNTFDSSIRVQNVDGSGIGLSIFADEVSLENFSSIALINESLGKSGDINIDASNISINGRPPLPFLPTAISLQNIRGNVGDINIKGNNLDITNGGFLTSTGLGLESQTGINSGDINLNVKNINITGETPLGPNALPISSAIATSTEIAGIGGDININANSIRISDHGVISTTAVGVSKSGNINVKTNDLDIIGTNNNDINQSGIFARSLLTDFFFDPQTLFLGESGDITIDSKNTSISRLGQIAVSNEGLGNAGILTLNSDFINLDNASLLASTNGGDGGNIDIVSEFIQLNNASISSSARGFGIGGNISISADLLSLINGSQIQANAENNQAGNVKIAVNGLIVTADSRIDATSNLGAQFDGTVEFNQTNTDITFLNIPFLDNRPSQIAKTTCQSEGSSIAEYGSGAVFNSIREKQFFSAALNKQIQVAQQYSYENSKGEVVPFQRWLGIQNDQETGSVELVFSPEQNKTLHNLINSEASYCS